MIGDYDTDSFSMTAFIRSCAIKRNRMISSLVWAWPCSGHSKLALIVS